MKNPFFYIIKIAWKYAKGRKSILILTYIMFAIANIVSMLHPLVFAKIVNIIQIGGDDLLIRVLPWILLYPILDLGFWSLHGPARVMERKTAYIIAKNYTTETYQKITSLPLKWHRNHHTGETYDKMHKANEALFSYTQDSFNWFATSIKMLFAFGAIIYFLPLYGSLSLLFGALVVYTVRKFDIPLIKTQKTVNDRENKVATSLFDYISNITTVITLRLEKLTQKEVVQKIQNILKVFVKNTKINELKWFTTNMIVSAGMATILILYIYHQLTTTTTILIGSFVALFQYLEKLNEGFYGITWQWEHIVYHSTRIKSAETIHKAYEQIIHDKKNNKPFPKWRNITISNLHFKYEDDKKRTHHIKDLTLHLKKGHRIALVGESGSGKSTLMKLLRGLDIPEEGILSVNEKEYKSISTLSKTTTLMPQEPEIFENTIEYNITAGIKHNKSEVNKAVKLSEFNQVLKRLPQGLASSIKEKGVNLSGGEKQRLALARGIFAAKDSSIILLDEPTSSVDPINEKQIYLNLFKHFKNHCIISSIHKLNLLPHFDHIYILENGKLVEEGSYETLSKKEKGHLKRMLKEYDRKKKE